MNRIKKGDKVRVISGKYKTQEGVVTKVDNKKMVAIVEGLNKVKMHRKASNENQNGGIKEVEAPMPLSKLALVVPKTPQGISKVAYKKNKANVKVRVARKTKAEINGKK